MLSTSVVKPIPRLRTQELAYSSFCPNSLAASSLDAVPNIGGHLPPIPGVRLTDIDEQKFYFALIFFRHGIESANLRPKGWSSIAAEHQRHRPLIAEGGQRGARVSLCITLRLKSGAISPDFNLPLLSPSSPGLFTIVGACARQAITNAKPITSLIDEIPSF